MNTLMPAIMAQSPLAAVLLIGIGALWIYLQKKDTQRDVERKEAEAKRDAERAETQKMMFDMHERSLTAQNNSTQAMTQTGQNSAQLGVAIDKLRESSCAQHDAVLAEVKKLGRQSLNGRANKIATA